MTRDFDLDPELERRLRNLAGGYEPETPARIRRFAADVAAGRAVEASSGALAMERVRRPALIPRPGKTALVLATVVVVVAVSVAGLVALRPNAATSSGGPQAPAQWSGLSWRDVTATAIPPSWVSGDTPMTVVYWHGTYYANPATLLWSSPDGATWHRVEGAPGAFAVAATDDLLFVVDGSCTPLSYTTDGQTWQTAGLRSGECPGVSSLAATPSAVVAVVPGVSQTGPLTVSVPYRSSDGVTWTKSQVPADMATVFQLGVVAGRSGFLAQGTVPEPSSIEENNQGGYSWSGDQGFWYSRDGSSWRRTSVPDNIGTTISFVANVNPWPQLQRGNLGDWLEAHGRGYHSIDDLTWTPDRESASLSGEPLRVTSDGSRILAQTTGPTFYVSPGDGTWRHLVNAGAAVPDGGRSWALAAGVLYVAGDHVFFGTPTQG